MLAVNINWGADADNLYQCGAYSLSANVNADADGLHQYGCQCC